MKFTIAAVAIFVAAAVAAPINQAKRQVPGPNETVPTMSGASGNPVAYNPDTMPGKENARA